MTETREYRWKTHPNRHKRSVLKTWNGRPLTLRQERQLHDDVAAVVAGLDPESRATALLTVRVRLTEPPVCVDGTRRKAHHPQQEPTP